MSVLQGKNVIWIFVLKINGLSPYPYVWSTVFKRVTLPFHLCLIPYSVSDTKTQYPNIR